MSFLNGVMLDADAARARHRNGAPGFYLAVLRQDAEYFAWRRGGNILDVEVDDGAVTELIRLGATLRPIPMTPMSAHFEGNELFIPEELFSTFNEMRIGGLVNVSF